MFINKIFKNKKDNTETEGEIHDLKVCPLYVSSKDELLQINTDEYILKENTTLVRVGEEIYLYTNNDFKLLKEPLSTIAKRNLNEKLESKIISYVDEIRTLIINASLNTQGYIFLRYYNFPIQDILNYGFEKFTKLLQSDGSNFDITQEMSTNYGCFGEREELDIKIKWL